MIGWPPPKFHGTRDILVFAAVADHLLTSLEALVRRHRSLRLDEEHSALHAELIAAEVAHELAVTRSALQRHPKVA